MDTEMKYAVELAVAEKDALRLKDLIRQKVQRYEGLTYEELRLLAAFFRIEFEPEEREDAENG